MDEAAREAWTADVEHTADTAAPGPLAGLAALLDHEHPPWPEGAVPPLGHWLYFLSRARQSRLGPDGHPPRAGGMPPAAFPRRMWAGSRVEFISPIPVGAAIERKSRVQTLTPKSGKSGNMLFLTMRHEIFVRDRLAVIEAQDIVYREAALPDAAPVLDVGPPAAQTGIKRDVTPDPVLLFRFSALTFNSHRIHYDRDFACGVERYPGLVVHGPLIATLLMDHVLRHHAGRQIKKFSFRAQRPLFDLAPFSLFVAPMPGGATAWAAVPGEPAGMTAEVEFD